MKKILSVALIMIVSGSFAQNCNFYYFQNNKTIEMTIYDKKGQANGKQTYKISDVSNSGGTTSATINSEMVDKNGKSITKGAGTMKCTDGIMMMDMKMMLPQQQQEQFAKANVQGESSFLEYPVSMNVGDQLKDANFVMNVDNNGMHQTVKMDITNRKVEGKEKITTSAGTWDCYKISYNFKMNIKTMGIGIPINMDGTEWFAPGFGVVKTQSKNGGTEITSIK